MKKLSMADLIALFMIGLIIYALIARDPKAIGPILMIVLTAKLWSKWK